MRVFGKIYHAMDVYIKIRVDLINRYQLSGRSKILIMSFHFSEKPFSEQIFPYRD